MKNRLPKHRIGNYTIRRSGEMKAEVEVVYSGKDEEALHNAYRLLAQFFAKAHRAKAGEAGEAR